MDGSRFDALARMWGNGTRRRVLQVVAGAGLSATLLQQMGSEDAEAACKAPGRRCKTKQGRKQKCCGGARCKRGRCRCTNGGTGCGKGCCQPGQICLNGKPDICVNGPKQPGDICDPNTPLACNSGTCVCITVGENSACTCREATCLGIKNGECTKTSQCCQGFCSEFENPPQCVV